MACETEENLPALADCIGEDNLLIGSDYGHNDPFEQRNFLPTLRSQNGIPSRVVEKMVRDNPCTFYGLQKDQEAAVVKMRGMIVVQA